MVVPRRILIWLPNWVGDAVMATPALAAMRRHFASGSITFLGKAAVLETVEALGYDDGGRIVDSSCQRPRLCGAVGLIGRLKREAFDLAVLLPNSFRTAAMARLGGVRRVAGYARDGRGWLLHQSLKPPRRGDGSFRPYPMIDYYADLAGLLGAKIESRRMTLSVTPEGRLAAEAMLARAGWDAGRPMVMLNPGGGFGPSKLWPADRYATVADALANRRGVQIIINCAPGERAVAREVAAAMRCRPLLNFAEEDNSIPLLKALMKLCRLVITNDTGARHIAAALDVPVVTIFGSTDPQWTRIDYAGERIVRADVPCSPCQLKTCPLRGADFHHCMMAVTTDMVLAAGEELLARECPP